MECTFCKIISGEIESNILYQDEQVIVFRDISPQAPVHLLVASKEHFESIADLTDDDAPLMGHMLAVATRLAREKGIHERGYRLVINTGPNGGQVVPHLHLHLLGGRQMGSLG